nr:hypothetical protein [Tanacetum cinerariifolium]
MKPLMLGRINQTLTGHELKPLEEWNRNSSSPKRVHFINTITIIRKEDDPREEGIVEPNATKNNDHNIIVEVKDEVGEELSGPKIVNEKGESRVKLSDEACRDAREVKEVGEWMEYDKPLNLVDTNKKSVYESLIEKMPSCSLNFDFRIENRDPSNLKILCMIGHMFIDNEYIDLDSPMNVMFLACYNTNRNQEYKFKGLNFIGIGEDLHVLLILDKEKCSITFTDGIKKINYKTPYRDLEMDDLTSEGHDLLSSRVILSKYDYRRGCERASDLKSGFYKDIHNLGPSYKMEIERIDHGLSFKAGGCRTSEGESRKEYDSESSYKTR